MNVMIGDLVDAARQEGGQLELKREPVDLRRYLTDLPNWNAETMEVARDPSRITGRAAASAGGL